VIARLARRRGDDGFTLVELTVAMVVTAIAMAALIIVFLGSIKGVALSKQRQTATGIATSMMEQIRSLDYTTLSAGLYCGDNLAADSNLTVAGACGSGGTVTLAPSGTGVSETVKVQTTSNPASAIPPLYPHVSTQQVENVTYTKRAYVTINPTTPAAFNLTVIVSWTSSSTKVTKTVVERSTEFSPSRCLSSATHPYSGACQAAFNADAGFQTPVITITDVAGSGNDIQGFAGKSLQLALGALSSTLDVEQITKLTGKVQTTSASVTADDGKTTTGGVVGTVSADSDPSSTTGTTQTTSVSQSSVNTLSLSGSAGVLNVVPASGGSGSLDAEVSSTSTSCKDSGGNTLIATLRPCSWGSRQSSGTGGSMTLQLPNGASNFTLASLGTSPSPSRASVAVIPGSGGTVCPTATGAGCVSAQASRGLGAVALGGLPTANPGDSPPVGWTGSLISVTGVSESAYSESGIGARTPSFTRTGGTLNYYDATTQSVKSLDLTALSSDTTVNVAPVTATYLAGGHVEQFTMSASFTAGKSTFSSTSAPDSTCKSQACTASATPSSTLVATLSYTISLDGATVTTFAMAVDLGACVARTSYTAAFDA
jgi:prepilin-type N-terminal cleavage/methylation domain-containing protein